MIHVLQVLENVVFNPDSLLVAIDVETLYSSIPHHLGLAAIQHILSQSHRDDKKIHKFRISALEYILLHNIFTFDGSHYLQVQGVAIGTSCVPSYENLYLGEWERSLLDDDDDIVPLMSNITSWYCYIDDVLLTWEGSVDGLNAFMLAINKNAFNLHFTMSYSATKITFLDVTIYKHEDGHLSSGLFRKPTAGNTILHASSAHPKSLICSIPFSQYLRLKRNCSTPEFFLN